MINLYQNSYSLNYFVLEIKKSKKRLNVNNFAIDGAYSMSMKLNSDDN